jgi:hypothetical protein
MERFEGYKTVVFFALSLIVAVANLLGFGEFELSASQQEILLVVIPVVGLILRYLTNSAIFEKSDVG